MMKQKFSEIRQSFNFGTLKIEPNVILSPMHGVTDQPFRRMCKELAGGNLGLLVSEFVSVANLVSGSPKEMQMLEGHEKESPFAVQIFGADLKDMIRGAQMAQSSGADAVEINCGCPAPKVVKRGGGSGLLKDLDYLKLLVSEIRKVTKIPLSMKVRAGWDVDDINAEKTLEIAEGEGLDLFVIHGRTRQQGYKGLADWKVIKKVSQLAKIPVVGNGDIITTDDIYNTMKQTKVSGVSIGRGAMHNPWVFAQIAAAYKGEDYIVDHQKQKNIFQIYSQSLRDYGMNEGRVLGKLKMLSARLIKCLSLGSELRMELLRSEEVEYFFETLENFYFQIEKEEKQCLFLPGEVKELNGKSKSEIEYGNVWDGN
jgi:nifR3 family TIM-barrel protein